MSSLLIQKNKYGQNLIALLDDDQKLKQLFVQRDKMLNMGEIINGKIAVFSKNPKGYFVQTSKGLSLFASSTEKHTEGSSVVIQVTKEARLGKDATGKIVSSDTLLGTPLIEKNLESKHQTSIQNNWNAYQLDEQLEEVLDPKVSFGNGAALIIERTQTCWTIDIDSGSSSLSLEEINQTAILIIYNQIILKNLSGIILIDFAGSKKFHEQENLKKKIITLFQEDNRTKIYGFTKLGLFEMRRNRTTAALADLFLTKEGFKNPVFLSYLIKEALQKTKIGRPVLSIHPSIFPFLEKEIISFTKIKLMPNAQPDFFEIKGE